MKESRIVREINTDNIYELGKWFKLNNSKQRRLHVTHNDLDGYTCRVVTEMALCALNNYNGATFSPVEYYHTMAGDAEYAVSRYLVKHVDDYVKGEDELHILITDLSGIDLYYYDSLAFNGHKITLYIVDHHQSTLMNDKHLTIHNIRYNINFYHQTDISASYALYKLLLRYIGNVYDSDISHLLNGTIFNIFNSCCFSKHIEQVSDYDTGKWAEWSQHSSYNTVDGTVINQLRFVAYLKETAKHNKDMSEYVHDIVNAFITGNINDIRKLKREGIASEWKQLKSEYKRLVKNMTQYINPLSEVTLCKIEDCDVGTFEMKASLPSIYIVRAHAGTDYYYYSLISREVLDNHPEIDILMCIYDDRKSVSLRSRNGGYNVADIAKCNGGGGHPCAAGFPLPSSR